jgi:hypothetical protein
MATKKTGMPLLKLVAQLVIRKIGGFEKTIRQNLGEGAWHLVEFLVSLASILVNVMEDNSNAEGDFLSPLNTASVAQINAVRGAVAAYKAANDITEAW